MKTLYLSLPKLLSVTKRHAAAFAIAVTALLPFKVFGQAPTISYSSPQTYATYVAIPPITPTASGVGAPTGAYGSPVVVGSGLSFSQNGAAVDAAGNMYVNDQNSGTGNVTKISADGSSTTVIASGFLAQSGNVAVDQAGNVYLADQASVWKIPASGSPVTYGTPVTIGSFSRPFGIAVDASGNIYVADLSAGVYKMANDGSNKVKLDNGISAPSAVAVDAAGNVYATDLTALALYEIPANGGSQIQLASGFSFPRGLAVDAAGTIYVDDEGAGGIFAVPAGGGTQVVVVSGLSNLVGVAVDAHYNLYAALQGNAGISKMSPTGGYFISPALPAGLTLDSTTGIISGTPTKAAVAADYLVSAYNASGGVSNTVNITVNGNASLSSFIISQGALSPSFTPAITSYTASVGNAVTSITVMPAAIDPNAAVTVNGTTVVSGSASGNLPLSVGPNTITTIVTGVNGIATKTYTLTVTRAPSANADLSNLVTSAGALTPGFASAVPSYTISVGNAVTSITITPNTADSTAVVTVNGSTVVSGSASGSLHLLVGNNTITTMVTAQDGTTTKTYTITVTRAPSTNADLSNLATNAGALTPGFANGTTAYSVGVAYITSQIAVTPTTADAEATITVNGTSVANGGTSGAIPLSVGANTVTIIVTASDNSTTKTYTVTVTRAPSNNALLSNVGLGYTTDGSGNTYAIVTPAAAGVGATITVNGTTVASGAPSSPILLSPGSNTIFITVTAQNGVTKLTYKITVMGPLSGISSLSALTISAGTLSPAFSGSNTSYTDAVANAITSVTVTPTTTDPNATVTVNGTAITSGTASGNIATPVGNTVIPTVVTAQDGVTTTTYTITVTRAPSADASLAGLSLSSGALSPAFTANTTAYTASVSNATTSLTATPVTNEPNATVTVNGTTVVSGNASASIPLSVGPNTITTVVTAQDGTTTQTYTVNVIRAPSNDASLSALTISSGALSPAFTTVTTSYADTVSNGTISVTLTPTVNNTNASVQVNGTAVISGTASASLPLSIGTNNITIAVTAQDGTTIKTYTITVTRLSNNANLSSLSLSQGTLAPVFASATTSYTTSVGNAISTIIITPTTADATATVRVNGTAVISGTASASLPLIVGTNSMTIIVTAQDGTTIKTYTVLATRQPAAPVISYTGPQTYITGVAVSPLAPASTGGPVAPVGYNTGTTTIGSGFSQPNGVAVDAAGNVYVADYVNNAVKKIPAGNGTPVIIGSGFSHPRNVAVDASGNVYVADGGNNAIKEIPVGGGAPVTLGSGFNQPNGVAVDAAGNVYVGDYGNSAVKKIPAGNGTPVMIGSGFTLPRSVAVDAAGNVFVADGGNTAIKKIPVGGGAPVTIGSGFGLTTGVAVDASGNVYVDDYGHNAVKMIPAAGGAPVSIGSGFASPFGVAADGAGNIYVGDLGNNAVKIIKPTGGYYISTSLPSGLMFANATGIISGTAAVSSPATNYTITTYNTGGSGQATVNIAVLSLPAISYTGPQTYTAGIAITPLTPASTSGAVAPVGYNTGTTTVGSGFSLPNGVAVDAAGNVYVADYGNNAVKKIPAGNGTPVILGSGFSHPRNVAVDAAGNVYVADGGNNAIKEIPVGGGAPVTLGSGFNQPNGVAVDAAGNVYVGDYGNNQVKKIPAGNGTPVIIGSGFTLPRSVAVDAAGNVFVADGGNTAIKKIPAVGGAPVTIGSGFALTTGVAVDASGNVYVSDYGNNAVKMIPAAGGAPVSIGSGFASPFGIAADGAGKVYVGDLGHNAVKVIKPTGGYYINTSLPAGLTFANTTGMISGTPAGASPAINYTVTAYNAAGSGQAIVNITTVQTLPVISYAGPQTYTAGVAISPLAPANTGVPVAPVGYNTSTTTIGSGFSQPNGVAVDAAGNVYVADYLNNAVKKIPSGNGTPVILGSGFNHPRNVAVDAAGNVYVADGGNNAIKEIPVGGGAPITLGSGFSQPNGVAVDATGNVYVADYGNSQVKKIPVGNGTPVIIGSGFTLPRSVAVDAAGNVYVADGGHTAVKMIPAGNGAPVTIGSGFGLTTGVAVDASGNVYVGDYGNNAVKMIPAAGGAPVSIGSGFASPFGVAADGAGNIYVGDLGHNAVKVIKPTGGYYINTSLPAGLTFANATGMISGTPTGASPAINYTVTAYNAAGSGQAIVNIKVTGNPNLAGLAISSGNISPVFAAGTISYKDTVINTVASVTITPTAVFVNSTIKVNGSTVTSGTASAGIPLAVGNNTITTIITAQDGVTTKTYTLTVRRLTPGGLNNLYLPGNGEQTAMVSNLTEKVEANNILSPNGDGINDIWVVKNIAFYPNNKVTVYNRAGEVIFTKKGYANDWGGTYRGSVLNEGTYYYLVDLGNGSTFKGFVTVVKDR